MSLFVDLRHLKTSVHNLSEMVDKLSTSACNDAMKSEVQPKKYERSTLYGSTLFKPALGLGVRFSQSQEDVYHNMPSSSRLRSHMSLPNLDKDEITTPRETPSKIIEIDHENAYKSFTKPIIQLRNDWIVASKSKRPHFDDSGETHPMDFLDDVKYYIAELNLPEEKQLPFVTSCLEGVPLMWARCFKNEFEDLYSFYTAFEREFWGQDRQKTVLYDMKLGKYDEETATVSKSEYFLHKVSNYRHLSPPPSDLEIVYSLAAHFPSAIELELRLSQKPSLHEAYRVLRRREGEKIDFLPNYLYEMCEAYQRGHRPDSARRRDFPDSTPRSEKLESKH